MTSGDISFATVDGKDHFQRHTFFIPADTPIQQLARKLAYDVFHHERLLRMAYLDGTFKPKVLIPRSWLPEGFKHETRGEIVGVPFEVVDGIEDAMFAYSLKITELPNG